MTGGLENKGLSELVKFWTSYTTRVETFLEEELLRSTFAGWQRQSACSKANSDDARGASPPSSVDDFVESISITTAFCAVCFVRVGIWAVCAQFFQKPTDNVCCRRAKRSFCFRQSANPIVCRHFARNLPR